MNPRADPIKRSRVSNARAEWLTLGLVLLIGLAVSAPLLQPGYFWGAHDARHDVYFIFQFDKAVQDGIWFPRWGPDWAFGYGYPFWIVYGPLATFIGELFHHFVGLGFEASVKAVFVFSILVSGLAMYGFVRSWLGRNAGLVAAVAYMTIPYHLVDVFVRAALAESLALAWIPLALWGFRAAVIRPRWPAILGAAAAYALIMWTSNLVAVVFTPALAAYVLVLVWGRWGDGRRTTDDEGRMMEDGSTMAQTRPSSFVFRLSSITRALLAPGLAVVLGLGLSAAFFVPAVVEQGYINRTQWFGEYYDPAQHFVYFRQLFELRWGFGISVPGPLEAQTGGMSYQLGLAATILSVLALIVARQLRPALRREVWFWALWAAVSIFLTLNISALVWRYAPLVPYAQFPWRYLMLAIIPLSILPATLVANNEWRITNGESPMARGREVWLAPALAGLLFLSSVPYLKVEIREPTAEQGPVSMAALVRFQRTSDEMTGVTAWVDPARRPMWSDMAELWVQGKEVITRVDYGQVPQTETLAVNAEGMGSAHEQIFFYAKDPGQTVTFNWFWYPGWTAWLLDGKDGRRVEKLPVFREDGPLARIVVPVPAGQGYILLRFEDTPLRTAAKWVTCATLLLAAVVSGVSRRKMLDKRLLAS